ncbi:MAG: diguanylate cyclase [bacterium]|nr:MAG: diguanylate cyclase [bacterium]
MARIVQRIEDIQDLTKLSEDLLSELMEKVDGLAGTIWILDMDQSFRNICARGMSDRRYPIDPGEIIHRHEEISTGKPFFEQRDGRVHLNSVFLPILHHDLLSGLVHIQLRTSKGTTVEDWVLKTAKEIVEEFSPFLNSALTLDKIRHHPLKDLDSDSYNETFLLDFVHRHINLCRRYRRRLGLISLEFEGVESFQKGMTYRLVQAMLRDVTETLRGIMREYDVVAHAGNFRFLIALPDTDSLGCRIAIQRIRKGFEQLEFLVERLDRFKLSPHFGFSCYPEDGTTVDQMLMRALERGTESRKDPFNMVSWRGKGFWDIVEEFTGGGKQEEIRTLKDTSQTRFRAGFTYLLQEAIAGDIVLHPDRRGLLFIGTDNVFITEALLQKDTAIAKASTRIGVLGDMSGAHTLKELNINTLSIPPERAQSFQFILFLTDLNAYGLVAVHSKGDAWRGLHTSHDRIVERLVFKLREEYSLQDQI